MKRLIIHPTDPSTTFLTGIYKDLPNKTVINGGLTKEELRKYIEEHDQVIMMGHGLPNGLFSVGKFPDSYQFIIDDSMVESLRKKNNSVFIWCFAEQFVKRHNLNGFATGMFISEVSEAFYFDFIDDVENLINESNFRFSSIVGRHIYEPLDELYENVMKEYGKLAKTNPIALFNFKRLYLSNEPNLISEKVINIH